VLGDDYESMYMIIVRIMLNCMYIIIFILCVVWIYIICMYVRNIIPVFSVLIISKIIQLGMHECSYVCMCVCTEELDHGPFLCPISAFSQTV